MKRENINKLLPAVAVFSFVAFAFAVANTFGNTYAVYSCADNWEYDYVNEACCPSGYTYVDGQCMGKSVENQCAYGVQTEDVIDGFDCVVPAMEGKEIVYTAHLTVYGDKDANMYENGSTTAIKEKTLTCKPTEIGGECAVSTSGLEVKKEGYTFTGWGTSLSCTEGKTTILTLTSEEKTDFYPCFKKNGETLTATFDANEGTLKGDNTKKCTLVGDETKCTITNLPTAEREGYLFGGWNTRTACQEGDKTSLDLTESKTYYACWVNTSTGEEEPDNPIKYTATFKPNGGTWTDKTTDDKKIEYTEKLYFTDERLEITPPSNTKEWCGWKTDNGEVWTEYIENENATLTAQWCDKEVTPDEPETTEYKITLNANGGTVGGKETKEEKCTTTSCEVKTPATKENHTFIGWSTTQNSCTSVTKTITINEDTNGKKYYACFTQNTYKITFNLDGGNLYIDGKESTTNPVDLVEVNPGKYTAKKDGYTFKGWRKSGETCNKVDGSKTITVTSDITLTACYTEDKTPATTYQVTFNVNNGKLLVDKKVTTQLTYKLDKVDYSKYSAEKDGYKFLGWSNIKGSCVTPLKEGEIEIKDDTSIVACYEKVEDKEDEQEEEKTEDKTDEEVKDNSQTGSTILYLLFLMAILSLVYTGYNAYKYAKSKM